MQFIFNKPLSTSVLLIFIVVFSRWISSDYDFSYFIVAGDTFVDSAMVSTPIHVENGPGYDGQFFYRYALNPFSTEQTDYGITLDHPAYRHQRIVYPLICWILSFGQPTWIPFMMILINMLAMTSIVFMLLKFCKSMKVDQTYALLPLLLSGLWMSLARDLAENVECFFIVSALYAFYKRKLKLFVFLCCLSVLTREPSAFILLPISLTWLYISFREKEYKIGFRIIGRTLLLIFPFVLLLFWKIYLQLWHQSTTLVEGSNNISMPFSGIYQGFLAGKNQLEDLHSYLEFILWIAFILWNVWFVVICRKAVNFKHTELFHLGLSISWLTSLIMASLYSYSVYVDDWAFLRVLSGFNIVSILLVISKKIRLPRSFIGASLFLVLSTLVRLYLRI